MSLTLDLELLLSVFDNFPTMRIGIFYVPDLSDNTDIRYVYLNTELLKEMESTKEKTFGKKIIEVDPEAYKNPTGLEVVEAYRKLADEGGSVDFGLVEYENKNTKASYYFSAYGIKKHYCYCILRNITEIEKLKYKLEKKNKELEELTYIVSHDLQEPLNTIISFGSLLEFEKESFSDIAKKGLSVINQSATRMKQFIRELLDFSKVDIKPAWEDINLYDKIDKIKIDLSKLIEDNSADIKYIGDVETLRYTYIDLFKLLENLIINAIKYRQQQF